MPEMAQHLMLQPWLGNVRELRNALEHAVIMARGGPLLPAHLPTLTPAFGPLTAMVQLDAAVRHWFAERMKNGGSQPPAELYQELLKHMEPVLLDEVMRHVHGNRWVAAQWLGLNRATVRKKLGFYNLTDAHLPPGPGEPLSGT
jgi:two-component system, NtrC family, nitrogen regulation response regulator GlnG